MLCLLAEIIIIIGLKMNKLIGVALFVAGIVFITMGYHSYEKITATVELGFRVNTLIEVWAGIVGGLACLLFSFMWIRSKCLCK